MLTNLPHALKAKEAASKRRASVVEAAAVAVAVMAAAAVEAVAVAAAVADTTATVVAIAVVAVDTTGINPTHKLNYSSPASAGLFLCNEIKIFPSLARRG